MRRANLLAALLASILGLPSTSALALAQSRATLQVNVFPGAANLPLWIAQREGFYAKRGLTVTISHPKGSVDQFEGLVAGRYPLVVTAFDNVIAYHSGQGAAQVGAVSDLIAVMGIDRGFLTLVAAPGITRIADLKGRTLAVDALSTGYTFALSDILRRSGVERTDVSFIAVGNSEARWKALEEERAQAALLTLPSDLEAIDQGSAALTSVAGSFGHYLANVVAVKETWAASHAAELTAFLRGTRDATTWLFARPHRARALAILHAQMPALDERQLERVYEALLDSQQGLLRSGVIDAEGARTVLALRAQYAEVTPPLQELDAVIDSRYLTGKSRPRTGH